MPSRKERIPVLFILLMSVSLVAGCDIFVTADQNGNKGQLGGPCDNGTCEGELVVCSAQDMCECQFVECEGTCCTEGQRCEQGRCVGDCVPDCSGKSCGDNDGCGGKCVVMSCGAGQYCTDTNPHCAPCDNASHCGQDCIACDAGQICSEGQCKTGCENECTYSGEQRCDPNGTDTYQVCGDHDGDGCLEWSPLSDCPSGETCSNGHCSTSCSDECSVPPDRFCENGMLMECADADSDPCFDKHLLQDCPKYCDDSTATCVECLDDTHCDDSKECTADSCDGGNCKYVPVGDGTECTVTINTTDYTGSCVGDTCFCNLADACGPNCDSCQQSTSGHICHMQNPGEYHCGCEVDSDCDQGMYCSTQSGNVCKFCDTDDHCGTACDDCTVNTYGHVCHTLVGYGLLCGCEANTDCTGGYVCAAGRCARTSWSVPDTGLSTCYNATDQITCPRESEPFYGQDANFSRGRSLSIVGNQPEFLVKDNVTSLNWTQKSFSGRNWAEAMDYCESLIYGGIDNWRLPTANELLTIVDWSRSSPAFDSGLFDNQGELNYWSSTVLSTQPVQILLVNFTYGYTQTATPQVDTPVFRCVSGGVWGKGDAPETRFKDNTSYYTDSATGLHWQTASDSGYDWQNALSYCEGLQIGGFSWHVPDINQALSLVDYDSDPAYLLPVGGAPIWTSTTAHHNREYAWVLDADGTFTIVKKNTTNTYVRCVSSGQ